MPSDASPPLSSASRRRAFRSVDREALARVPLFESLDETVFRRLLANAEIRSHRVGAVILDEGRAADHLYVLLRGRVELYAAAGGDQCGILLLSSGDLFMPAASLFAEPYLNSARVIERARIATLDSEVVRAEARRSPELAFCLARALAGQFRMAVRHIIDLKCRSGPQRLAALLLRVVDEGAQTAQGELPAPKKVLAARVGMSAETLSRALQTLASQGLVVRGHRIEVRDRSRIERFIGPRLYSDDCEGPLDVFVL